MRPLAGITILDCSRVLAGPFCAMLLADLGADVIKIEQPGSGDETRGWGPPFVGGESPYFWSANRNKRSLTLNLASADGQQIFRRLAARADAMIENFRLGTLQRWGLDTATLHQLNPRLVHTAITGYGTSGPDSARAGYDLLLQAEAGWMSITGPVDGPPSKHGVALVDVLTGSFAATATLAALRQAEQTGQGQRVDCSLLQSAVAGLVNVSAAYLATDTAPQRWGNAHATIVPYQLFSAADRPFVLAVGNDRQWQHCCAAIGRADLASDARFSTNAGRVRHRAVLVTALAQHFATQPAAVWTEPLIAAGVPAGLVQTLPDVFRSPQAEHLHLTSVVEHAAAGTINVLSPPFTLSAAPADVRLAPPVLGQHTDLILNELGYDQREIERWRSSNVI